MPAQLIIWHDDLVADLRNRCAAGESARTIAAAYGTTRNAIIGKCRRLGMAVTAKGGGQRGGLERPKPPRGKVISARQPKPKKVASHRPDRKSPPKTPRVSKPCCLLNLTNETCRWPLWNEAPDAPRLFCGAAEAKLHDGMPYCAEHAKLAFGHAPHR